MLSKRIELIHSLVTKDIVYDLCCDHGKIGHLSLKENKEVYFVDQVQKITEKLSQKYSEFEKAKVICDSILNLRSFKENSSIIVAGVGANLLKSFLDLNIINESQEIIISTHSNQYIAYQAMLKAKLVRTNDSIIEDEGRFYEIFKCQLGKNQEQVFINKDFPKYKESPYYRKQLDFYKHKAHDPICADIYKQLKAI